MILRRNILIYFNLDGRSSRVLIVDEKPHEEIQNSTNDEPIPKTDTLILHKVEGSSEHLYKTEHGTCVRQHKLFLYIYKVNPN